jgi:hypothetical protein
MQRTRAIEYKGTVRFINRGRLERLPTVIAVEWTYARGTVEFNNSWCQNRRERVAFRIVFLHNIRFSSI